MPFDWNLLTLVPYFTINISLSISNKLVLQQLPYPWLLTTLHSLSTALGCLLLHKRYFSSELSRLTRHDQNILIIFSGLFTLNILTSNLSLSLISLALHQALRSTGPIATIAIQWLWYDKRYEQGVHLSLLAMSIGIVLATIGDYDSTVAGSVLAMLGVVLAAVKTIATNRLMTGSLKLHPLEALLRLCPLAAIQSLLGALLAGEISSLTHSTNRLTCTIALLVLNAALAFAQNVVSFHTNKVAGPLTITVCANLKQLATIVLGVVTFKTRLSVMGGIGMVLALGGSAWYSATTLAKRETDQAGKKCVLPR